MTTERESRTANIGFAKKRASWLFELSASHQLLWCNDNFELRNPLLRKAKNRYRKPRPSAQTPPDTPFNDPTTPTSDLPTNRLGKAETPSLRKNKRGASHYLFFKGMHHIYFCPNTPVSVKYY
jgi:hypothetical protein